MISVFTLNLRFGLADDGPNSWQYRKKGLPHLFKAYPADFYCFQEANDFQTDELREILVEYGHIGQRSPSPPFWQNNIIFYRQNWACKRSEHFFLSPTPTIPSRFRESLWPRQCSFGLFEDKRRRFLCANTHLDFDPSVQVESAKLIMDRLSEFPSDIPAVLAGDFNTTPLSLCHEIFTGDHAASEADAPCFKNAFQSPFPGTHHGFTGTREGDHIDWILYRGPIRPTDARVVRDFIDGVYPSDHFALYATFEPL